MHKGLVLALVAILGVSMVGVGHMTGSGNDNGNDWFTWWKNFDFKKFIGFMSSGGNDDDDDDDDPVDQSPIDSASISFNIGIRKLNDDSFQNVVDKCIFSSKESFSPLCVKCDFLNDAKPQVVVAHGEKIKLDQSYSANTEIPISMNSVPPVGDGLPANNDVRNVHDVRLTVCGIPKDECDDRDTCKCDERKKDHGNHYYDFYKRYDDNKNKFGKADYTKFINDYEKYMNDNGKYMDRSDFKIFMDYHGQFLKDNKKYFSFTDYNRYSGEHKKYSNDYPNHDEKCNCHGEKEDHKKHYDDFDKYYKYNKNKFGKAGYSKYMNDYENYFDDERKYMDSSDYKMYMDYHEKFLNDNKKYFSSGDYNHYSDEHKKYSKDKPRHDEEEDECKEKSGFFVGGGKVYAPKSGGGTFTLTHGFELHCDKTQAPNNLEINWLQNKFHLEELEKATCIDDGTHNEPPPSPHPGPTLDVYNGEGYGRYNGQCGAYATWSMDDNGEPGKNDQIISLKIYDTKGGNVVLDINDPLKLKTGNHQFVPHPSSHPNPHTQTNPCPEMTP